MTLDSINNGWELKCFLLEIREMVKQHTAINLSNYLEDFLDSWNLPVTQIRGVVTDNASNITAMA